MTNRFLVGVLNSGEPQFESCIEAINRQQDVEIEIETVTDLPNKAAHDALYEIFMSRANQFDYMVKVDADMVISRSSIFSEIAALFRSHPELKIVTAPVLDYFTDQMVIGLHAFHNSVRWPPTGERVFVDDPPVPIEQRDVFPDLAPAAAHCPDPSIFQSFYFGVHKGLKVLAALDDLPRREGQLDFHWDNIEKIWQHAQRNSDHRLLVAALGGELAIARRFNVGDLDRDSERVRNQAEKLEGTERDDLRRRVRRLRRRNRLGLSSANRLETMRDGFPRFFARRLVPRQARPAVRVLWNALRGR